MRTDDLPPILIADDDADDQFMLRRALEKSNVRNPIIAFNDGDDLLEYLDAVPDAPPCLLFLDLNMPRLTGFDVLAHLQQRRLAVTPVVISGSEREEDIDRAKRLGAIDYLVKFPAPARLAEIVQAVMKGRLEERCA
jgi:CheY-like chemotaxis protein